MNHDIYAGKENVSLALGPTLYLNASEMIYCFTEAERNVLTVFGWKNICKKIELRLLKANVKSK